MKIYLYLIFLLFLTACLSEGNCVKSDKCSLVPDPGLCKAYIPKYYYDKSEEKCKEFIWGGCGGVVPFDTLEECKACESDKVKSEE